MNKRFREWGLSVGRFKTGVMNSLTDVPGVLVGYHSLVQELGSPGPMTGVTAILPSLKVLDHTFFAGTHSFNGAGEMTGTHQINEWGFIETPILFTNTHGIGAAHSGCVKWMIDRYPQVGRETVVLPIVAECDDSGINDVRVHAINPDDAIRALNSASTQVLEGNVGGGTGMITCSYKAGTGSSSRLIQVASKTYTLGILLQSNWGSSRELRILGRSIGELDLESPLSRQKPKQEGSLVAVLATDAPLSPLQLQRLSKRCALGLARCGSTARHGSGEIFLAFSTCPREIPNPDGFLDDSLLNDFFEAACDLSEEAVYNSLLMAQPCASWSGTKIPTLDGAKLVEALKATGIQVNA